ncbi:MAG TPA: RNA polymerase sigma-70 factor [Ktedonobacterales bacterium]|nr:RNA polymerase sigma-70 factor [Ktedonobacterales bacterium]
MARHDEAPDESTPDALASFESYRAYLFAIAYRMLGSAMDAEDMVQETYLRYQATPPESIVSLKAFLTTVLTRLCMDQLHLARRKREVYPGPWLPEPIFTEDDGGAANPERRIDLHESLSLAFLTLLEDLPPLERAVFLLREVFDYEYAEVAAFLGRSEVAVRQSFSRAKKHLADHRPRFAVSPDVHRQMLTSFMRAAESGDMAALMAVLAEDVTLWADAGGKVRGAAPRPIVGRQTVAAFVLGTERFAPAQYRIEVATVNQQPAMLVRTDDGIYLVLTIEVEAGLIARIRVIANPDKLAHLN